MQQAFILVKRNFCILFHVFYSWSYTLMAKLYIVIRINVCHVVLLSAYFCWQLNQPVYSPAVHIETERLSAQYNNRHILNFAGRT